MRNPILPLGVTLFDAMEYFRALEGCGMKRLAGMVVVQLAVGCSASRPVTRTQAQTNPVELMRYGRPELPTAAIPSGARASVWLPPVAERVQAPEIDGGIAWLNTDHPLRMADLRGQVVLVDFWTYCCINCMHTLPVLAEIEARHRGDPVSVLGVHSAKFPGEREADRIAEAMGRYGIEHPVLVDQNKAVWNRWEVNAWPSVFVIDTQGRIVGVYPGEPTVERLDAFVNALLDEGRTTHTLRETPLPRTHVTHTSTEPLAYPGKVISLGNGRIAFSDTGHHRIVVATESGQLEAIIGAGIVGNEDGDFEHARFNHPQGIAVSRGANGQAGDVLYVADTENHEVRRVDLKAQSVTTIAGTGALSRVVRPTAGTGTTVALRSPWDLVLVDQLLLIAMAGSHQIWSMDLTSQQIGPWAGSGAEDRDDGLGFLASFAQPSGLAVQSDSLFVADSETSSIRIVDLVHQRVRTLVGEALFTFGDVDGTGGQVRLQHPLGLAVIPDEPSTLYVADTYNHKIKKLRVNDRAVTTIAGSTTRDPFFEPSGLTWTGTDFVVADTNHHRLVRMSRDGRNVVPIVFATLTAPTEQWVDSPAR